MTDQRDNEQEQDWDYARFVKLSASTAKSLAAYVDRANQGLQPVSKLKPLTEIRTALKADHLLQKGGLSEQGFSEFLETYLEHSTQLHHPNYMAHQVASPGIPSALADFIHGAINNPMAIYEMGSTAATLEHVVINWMLDKLGWPEEPLEETDQVHGAGVLMHGGSLANLVSLLAARSAIAPDAWVQGNPTDLKVLAPANSHYSIVRALSIMGLGSQALVPVAVDAEERIIPAALEDCIQTTLSQGQRIMAVVANACSTGSGLFDPLTEVADCCAKHHVWFHVDACHGGSFLLSDQLKHLLKGAERSDSLVWDAHKMMRVSSLCTAVLVKNSSHLQHAFQQQASYLFYGSPSMGKDFLHRTVECTKSALATKLFLSLAWQGEQALAEYIEDRVALTQQAYHLIDGRKNFYCPYHPESNILCFRYKDDDELQITIRETLLNAGIFHLTSTDLNGKRYLRITIMTTATSLATIEQLIEAIESRW